MVRVRVKPTTLEIIWSEQIQIDEGFIVKKQTNLIKTW